MSDETMSLSPLQRLFPPGYYDGHHLDKDHLNLLISYPAETLELFQRLTKETCESIQELSYNKLSLLLRFPNHARTYFGTDSGIDIEKVHNTAYDILSITLKGF